MVLPLNYGCIMHFVSKRNLTNHEHQSILLKLVAGQRYYAGKVIKSIITIMTQHWGLIQSLQITTFPQST